MLHNKARLRNALAGGCGRVCMLVCGHPASEPRAGGLGGGWLLLPVRRPAQNAFVLSRLTLLVQKSSGDAQVKVESSLAKERKDTENLL